MGDNDRWRSRAGDYNDYGAGGGDSGSRGHKSRYRPYSNWRGRGRGQGSRSNVSNYRNQSRSGFQGRDYLMPLPVPDSGRAGGFASPPPRPNHRSSWGQRHRHESSESRKLDVSVADSESEETGQYDVTVCDISSPPRLKQMKLDSIVAAQMADKYPGFHIYFLSALSSIANILEKISATMDYMARHELVPSLKAAYAIEEQECFDVSYEQIMEDKEFVGDWSSFEEDLTDHADDVMNIWGMSMHTLVHNMLIEHENSDLDKTSFSAEDSLVQAQGSAARASRVKVSKIEARLMKLRPITPIKSIRSTALGKFVTVRGAVIRTGTVKPYCTVMTFRCSDCLKRFVSEQLEGRASMPTKCPTFECRSKTFEALETEKATQFSLARIIRLQDIHHDEMERGSVPRTIDCRLGNSLHSLCNAGDAITVCGVVKFHHESGGGFGAQDQQLHNFYIDVIAVRNHKDCDRTMGGNWFTFSNKDFYAVQEIHDSQNLFRLLVASICPTIFGHNLVKAGLLLCLFGGSPPNKESTISRRSDINVLIVGDPGIGKSQMLSVVCDVAPRGVYVCGTATTVAGLTVTLVKDGDDYSLEAGALVMADRGICCIDEFDKMQAQHSALLEAMEQQSISVAKSGVFRTLPARTSIIAAANPVGGHYNARKSIAENIKINPALLSRFDLTFILIDKSDEETDRNIVNHILGMRAGSDGHRSQAQISALDADSFDGNLSLREKLKFGPNEEVDLIPHHLLRKYIAYARQYVSPKLSPEAASIIKKYYLALRIKHRTVDTTPVTTRQLESLLRLTQARAKIELREVATEQDAKDVLEIFQFGMASVFEDDAVVGTALSQLTNLGTPGGPPKKSHTKGMAKKLLSSLQDLSYQLSKNIFTVDEIKQVGRTLGVGPGIDTLVSALNNEGFLLNKGGKVYQLQSSDF